MHGSLEKPYRIKLPQKSKVNLNKSATDTLEMLTVALYSGDDILSHSQVFRRHKTLKDGREQVEDEESSGRPPTSKTD
ncbi:hypothetical protein J437_LFUL006869 [Ladona fulva]|uniref:Uncharacterized protein n=1 Tax=Ladona fulva TaxID=123851 RepID=A0A8K0KH42_LADFU|nr:hypothetical protein J437_LFUL006869 [Ladona fulva]